MDKLFDDATAWIYVLTLAVAIYGAGLFFWWWRRRRSASSVFIYVAFLFVGEIIESSMALYARFLMFVVSIDAYSAFMKSWFWPGRKLVTLIAFFCIVIHMSWRVFCNPAIKHGE